MGIFVCRISKAFHTHFTCSLKGWKLDINKIKLKQFLRDLWCGLLSSRSALAWGFFWVCCSIVLFSPVLLGSLALSEHRVAQSKSSCPVCQPALCPALLASKNSCSAHWVTSASSNTLQPLKHCARMMPQLFIFIRNMTLIFTVWKSWSVFKHFFPHNRPSVRGK